MTKPYRVFRFFTGYSSPPDSFCLDDNEDKQTSNQGDYPMSKFIKSAAAAAVLATSATGVQAASLSTDVDVQLPSIIALYCYDSVSVNVGAAGLEAALGAGPVSLGASAEVTSLTQDLGASSSTASAEAVSSVNLNLNNVCAFRALVTNGVDVAVTQPEDSRLMNGTAFIDAAGITLASGDTTDVVNTGLGLAAAATPVSVVVPLDLADATAPGNYAKAGLFTITVTAN